MTTPLSLPGRLRAHGRLYAEAVAVFLGGIVIVLLLGGLMAPGGAVAAAFAVYVLGGGLAAYGLSIAYPHEALGLCNAVTLIRLALMASLTALLFAPGVADVGAVWLAFGIAVLALALDGVDGWAARRAGLTSRFGARFDMEVDSAFALLLALLAFDLGHAGLWVLALGLPRYLFVVAGWIWPWLQAEVPDNFSRKAVCVLQIGVLVALVMPWTPGAIGTTAGLGAVGLVAWSFARDIQYLRKHRG